MRRSAYRDLAARPHNPWHRHLVRQSDGLVLSRACEVHQKVANRITVSLILAALIVGAAMPMRMETSFRIWGYPGLAIVFCLVATGGGITLLINILFCDKSGHE